MMDYNVYVYSFTEKIQVWCQGFFLAAVFGYLFYDSISAMFFLGISYGVLNLKLAKKKRIERRRWELHLQFREGITGLLSALQAGYSLENAFSQAEKDLYILYHGESFIEKEFSYIEKQLACSRNVEELLEDMASRSGIEDIRSFAEVFSIAKRMGGDMVAIIRSTVQNINEKLEIKREIRTMVAAKKLEGEVMNFIPPVMIFYLRITSPGLLDPLYHNVQGAFTSTILLLLYVAAMYMGRKIMELEV